MKENTQEFNLDALHAGIAELREQIAALTTGLKKVAEHPQRGGPAKEGEALGGWAGFQDRLEEVGAKGGKVIHSVTDEIERHPLLGGIALFGLGFFIATLLFKRSHPHHAQ